MINPYNLDHILEGWGEEGLDPVTLRELWNKATEPLFDVLVVDDEPTFTRLVKYNLEADGHYHVFCENDARKALSDCLDLLPDVVLLDLRMPQLDGEEVYRQIRENPALNWLPVVKFSAELPGTSRFCKNPILGEDGHLMLAKPASLDEINQAIRMEIQNALEDLILANE
tara:strand:+ start:9668 stop:10177 length:510 start_codon:yes stop_codon:yes gene_type:complete